jgi:hypothetical protein
MILDGGFPKCTQNSVFNPCLLEMRWFMATVTKKELIDRIAERTQAKRVIVKSIVQAFLEEVTISGFSKPGQGWQESHRIPKRLSALRSRPSEQLSLRWDD